MKCLPVITWNKKYLPKKLQQHHTRWRKSFLQLLLLKVFDSFLFRQSNKTCSILGLYQSYLVCILGISLTWISRVDYSKWLLLLRINFYIYVLHVEQKINSHKQNKKLTLTSRTGSVGLSSECRYLV